MKKLAIINAGIIQREKLLAKIIEIRKQFENQSDFGWFMTLGSEALGMLAAVNAGREARTYAEFENKLKGEMEILKRAKQELES